MHILFVKKSTTVLIAVVASLLGVFIAYAGFSGDTFGAALIRGAIVRNPAPKINPPRRGISCDSDKIIAKLVDSNTVIQEGPNNYGRTFGISISNGSGCSIYGSRPSASVSNLSGSAQRLTEGDIYPNAVWGPFNFNVTLPRSTPPGGGSVWVTIGGCTSNIHTEKGDVACPAGDDVNVTVNAGSISWYPAAPTCASHPCSGDTPFLCFDGNNWNVGCQATNVPPFGGTCLSCAAPAACPPAGYGPTAPSCPGVGICQTIAVSCVPPGQTTSKTFYKQGVCQKYGVGEVPPSQCVAVCTASNAATACNDNNPCTSDTCNTATPAGLCVNTPNTNTCTIGTTPGTCSNGTCQANPVCTTANASTNCNDNNPCTTDTCNVSVPGGSCVHVNNSNACTIGTTQGTCSNGTCLANRICGDGHKDADRGEECDGSDGITPPNEMCGAPKTPDECKKLYGRCTAVNQCTFSTNATTGTKSCASGTDCCSGTNRPDGCSCSANAANCASNFCTASGLCGQNGGTCSGSTNRPDYCGCTLDQQCRSSSHCSGPYGTPAYTCLPGPAPTPTPTPAQGPDSCGGQARPNPNPCFTDWGYSLVCVNNTWLCQYGG